MANDFLNSLPASTTDWDKALNVVRRLDAARKHLARDSDDLATGLPVVPAAEVSSAPAETKPPEAKPIETVVTRPTRRPLSVWILVGALWISIGMIISATIVAVAYLA